MEHITSGHWIFALCFAIAFVGYLIWSYKTEVKLNRIHYKGSILFIFSVIIFAFLVYVFRGYMM
jgi:membrane protein CcdC involved in cytochrome C biogenesis